MRFLEKVASYANAYINSDNKETLIKTAAVDGVTPDDMIAYHNLTEGNIFTGENIIKIAGAPEESESPIIRFGFELDKLASGEATEDEVIQAGLEMGLDMEDMQTIFAHLQKQAAEAFGDPAEERFEKVAEALDYLAQNGIDPAAAIDIVLNTDEEGNVVDEKVAAYANALSDEDLVKIAEAIDYMGGLDEESLSMIESILASA